MIEILSKIKRLRRVLFWIIVVFSTTILSHGGNTGQGDEPHYLMIADSLWFDHDLDLRNNYADRSNIVYNGNLGKEPHTREGRDGGWYSVHSFGLPVLSLPVYGLGYKIAESCDDNVLKMVHLTKWTLLRDIVAVCMILIAATLAVLIYDYLALSIRRPFAFLVVLCSFLACPLLPLGFLFFTEMPAAFLAFIGFRQTPSTSLRSLILRASAIAYLPFLHVKYLVLSGMLLLLLCCECWKEKHALKRIAVVCGIYLLGQGVLSFINYQCWGSIAPYASWGGMVLSKSMHGTGLLGLLLDQQFGLVWVAPLYWLSVTGAFIFWKTGRRNELVRLLLVLVSILAVFANFPMWWAGWSPSARFLTPVVIFVIPLVAVAVQFYWNMRFQGLVVKALLLYQFVLAAYFWQHQKLMWNLPDGKSKLFAPIGSLLPSIIVFSPRDAALSAIWIVAGLLLAVPFIRAVYNGEQVVPRQTT